MNDVECEYVIVIVTLMRVWLSEREELTRGQAGSTLILTEVTSDSIS